MGRGRAIGAACDPHRSGLMRVVYFGSGEFAVPALRWLAHSPHEIAAVVTQPDRPAGRGKKQTATPVGGMAESLGLPVYKTEDTNEAGFVEQIRSLGADLGIVAAFGQKLHAPLRSAFAGECINIHSSLLPKYRGAAPINWAILKGEPKTGVSVFRLVDRLDAGPVLIRRETMIGSTETAAELHDRLAGIACDALGATLKLLEQDLHHPGEPQDESLATQAPKLTKADGMLRFDEPAEQIALRCRAMWSWPGARCLYRNADGRTEEIIIATASAIPAQASEPPGTITSLLTVATRQGTLEIHGLKPAGKRVMSWQDFVNGRHVKPGDRLEAVGP
ncbi:MAG TPA: methionyl-tRNA formyltransferase [Phycisphaerae bacterium]|nr:methionyl-tRNA formyltransferase [Phycisphaerae bacterium]HRR83361.1 methionyl-tRNA formyltransferase [Phycisphaerae bacterium]